MATSDQDRASPIAGPILIEFAGLPGSGKSTVSHALAASLGRRGVEAREPSFDITEGRGKIARRVSTFGYLVRAAGRKPLRCLAAMRVVRPGLPGGFGDAAQTAWNLLAVTGTATPARGATVLDQGPIQALWSVAFSANGKLDLGAAERWLHAFAADFARWWIVFVDVPEELALARLEQRESQISRLQDPTRPDRVADAQAALAECQRAAEQLERAHPGKVQILRIRSRHETDRDEEVARLVEAVAPAPGRATPHN